MHYNRLQFINCYFSNFIKLHVMDYSGKHNTDFLKEEILVKY